MGVGDKRRLFTRMLAQLIQHAQFLGFEVAIDFSKRCEDCPIGHPQSLHKLGLAVDLNLFLDGHYLTKTDDHRPLGEFWEFIGGTWGGRFNDGNHYSLEHNGMK